MILVQEWAGDAYVVVGVFSDADSFVREYMLHSEGFGGDDMASKLLRHVGDDRGSTFNHYMTMEDGGQEYALQFMITEIQKDKVICGLPLNNYKFKPAAEVKYLDKPKTGKHYELVRFHNESHPQQVIFDWDAFNMTEDFGAELYGEYNGLWVFVDAEFIKNSLL